MIRNSAVLKVLVLCTAFISPYALSGVIQLTDATSMSLVNNFESAKDTALLSFETTASIGSASSYASSVTPSPTSGLVEFASAGPMTGTFSSAQSAVGMWFGNDDFNLVFDVVLEVFTGATSLGSVSVTSNANDNADQFIGLFSTDAFDSFQISYQRPEAGNLAVYIDEVYAAQAASPVPEPFTLSLLGLSLLGLGFNLKRNAK